MRDFEVIGHLYLFKLQPDYTVKRVALDLIKKTEKYYLTRDPETGHRNSYLITDIDRFKSKRVVTSKDDLPAALQIMKEALDSNQKEAAKKASKAMCAYSDFFRANLRFL